MLRLRIMQNMVLNFLVLNLGKKWELLNKIDFYNDTAKHGIKKFLDVSDVITTFNQHHPFCSYRQPFSIEQTDNNLFNVQKKPNPRPIARV